MPIYAAFNFKTAHAQLLHGIVHLLHGQIRMLQGYCAQPDEAVRVQPAKLGDFFVLQLNNTRGQITICPIAVTREKADGLDVDAMSVHVLQAIIDVSGIEESLPSGIEEWIGAALLVIFYEFTNVNNTVAVNIDGGGPLAADGRLASLCRGIRGGSGLEAATISKQSCRSGGPEKLAAVDHSISPMLIAGVGAECAASIHPCTNECQGAQYQVMIYASSVSSFRSLE